MKKYKQSIWLRRQIYKHKWHCWLRNVLNVLLSVSHGFFWFQYFFFLLLHLWLSIRVFKNRRNCTRMRNGSERKIFKVFLLFLFHRLRRFFLLINLILLMKIVIKKFFYVCGIAFYCFLINFHSNLMLLCTQ